MGIYELRSLSLRILYLVTLILLILLFLGGWIFSTGCTPKTSPKNSIILIAVERLRHIDVRCSQLSSGAASGFEILCNEAQRFPHHWLESTHALPNLAAIFAGPLSLKQNRSILSSKKETLAEIAHKNKYRTSFWPSGPPYLRGSGITQGFEHIEDLWSPSQYRVSRPFYSLMKPFLEWLDNNPQSFSAIVLSDLNEPWFDTKDELGVSRPKSLEGQIEELDSRLAELFQALKKQRRWENSWIIVLGITGRSEADRMLAPTLDLHSENMQTPLFVKPPFKERDPWSDPNQESNLIVGDLNAFLKDVLSEQTPNFQKIEDRPLAQSGIYLAADDQQQTTSGFRINHFLIHEGVGQPLIYNSLIDSFERTLWNDPQDQLLKFARQLTRKKEASTNPPQKNFRQNKWQFQDFWDSKITQAKMASLLTEYSNGRLRDLMIYLSEQNGFLLVDRYADSCELAFQVPLESPEWKNCALEMIPLLKAWSADMDNPLLTAQLSRELSLSYLLETSLRVDLSLGRPWQLDSKRIRNLWVMERLLKSKLAPDMDNTWRDRLTELKKSIKRKPVL